LPVNREEESNRSMLKAELGTRLKSKLAELDWSQSEFARHCDLPRDAVSTYVRGRSMPKTATLLKMASVLGCEPQELVPNYRAPATGFALRESPNDDGNMQISIDMRLPKNVALQIFKLIYKEAS
jgi:transcriptional regulator with XRE-family HTH domain